MRTEGGSVEGAWPFLRWAGAKRSQLSSIEPYVPRSFIRYFEPFLGGGSLFFRLQPERARLGDIATRLIETYRAVRDGPRAVARAANQWPVDRQTFYAVRSSSFSNRWDRAGQFIYLNKTCWNGLYRVNLSGQFNVPYGRPKSSHIINSAQLAACARALRRAELAACDFEELIDGATKGDLVYFDPPYVTAHHKNGFVEYNEHLFAWADQLRLAKWAHELAARGAHVIVTNADHPSVRSLYDGFAITTITRYSTLASRAESRGPVTELVISTP